MADRWSVWADERVRKLAARCVAAADEVWRLQNGTDAESAFFQRMIGQDKPGGGDGLVNGKYSNVSLWIVSVYASF